MAHTKRIERLLDTLEPEELREILAHILETLETQQQLLQELRRDTARIAAQLPQISATLQEHQQQLASLHEDLEATHQELADIKKTLNTLNLTLGGLTEAVASRYYLEDLRRRGAEIIEAHRNYIFDNEEVDLYVRARHQGREQIYILEVKVKPKFEDIGALLAKKELLETIHPGTQVTPVLAGTYISQRLQRYAEAKNVQIYRL